MSAGNFLNEPKVEKGGLVFDAGDTPNEESDFGVMKTILENDPNIFLLNNLLMSVQFFENYERDVQLLRENWFRDISLEPHHKKCFYADSLFKLSEANVKFVPRHGQHKNTKLSLHPFRIYISSDNVEAAFDPSALGRNKLNVWPQYQFTVKTNENLEKNGYISLIEFKTLEAPIKSPKTKTPKNHFVFHDAVNSDRATEQNYFQRKSVFEEKYQRRLTKTERFIGSQNRKSNLKMLERRSSLKTFSTEDSNGFYKFINSDAKLKRIIIHEFRMNSILANSHEIPLECFQKEEIKKKFTSRRTMLGECFRSQIFLNSAAFKGYFCDLLIDKIPECLNLDANALNESSILEEFIMVKQKGSLHCLTPIIAIRDWNNFVIINKNFQEKKTKQLAWPSDQMQKIIKILPCNAVPIGCFESQDYEKTWKLVFPKAEEFLILHMMHSHVRCYFFVLILYKTFIENEINSASLGPKHLLHLLFWRVHKNFIAWPEDRPGETLINYFKILYKKLQNKFLGDFFIPTRNLFADSLPKDLHKAQALIKKIIENPIPHIMKAMRNLQLDYNFYPSFDVLKLNDIINPKIICEKLKETSKKKKEKIVTFKDEEQQWKKIAMKQITLERKAEEEEQARKGSIESIDLGKILDLNAKDLDISSQILGMFMSHFIEMAYKSIEYNYLSQALLYLNQTQKLFELNIENGMREKSLKATRQRIIELREVCYRKLKKDLKRSSPVKVQEKAYGDGENMQTMISENESMVKQQVYQKEDKKVNFSDEIELEDEVFSSKL